ncbi:hypothetical protein V6N11_027029 [Hibiscus sabdariffa]|uniref:Uncharacterized protein n=1 Tax=Hibiscus sabdariffa TaxID=183260 RepID=A0ABR2PG41_9ROSI
MGTKHGGSGESEGLARTPAKLLTATNGRSGGTVQTVRARGNCWRPRLVERAANRPKTVGFPPNASNGFRGRRRARTVSGDGGLVRGIEVVRLGSTVSAKGRRWWFKRRRQLKAVMDW